MKASFVDLRTKSAEIIKAINRKERVTVFYRGKPAAVMQAIENQIDVPSSSTRDHAAFGMWADRADAKDVAALVRRLRRGRLDAL